MKLSISDLNDNQFPKHLGIILDGNRRWAKKSGLSKFRGHRAGMSKLKDVLKMIEKTPIEIVSVFVFSKENWSRTQSELDGLFKLLRKFFNKEFLDLKKRGIKVYHSGDMTNLDEDIKNIISTMVEETANNEGKKLNIAFNYSGRSEIQRSLQKIVRAGVKPDDISEDLIAANMDNPELGDIDLLIRTSGEARISNFFLWQIAYTELFFTDVYWPDFSQEGLDEALLDYAERERRFGGR